MSNFAHKMVVQAMYKWLLYTQFILYKRFENIEKEIKNAAQNSFNFENIYQNQSYGDYW